jgi:hypothetical protein
MMSEIYQASVLKQLEMLREQTRLTGGLHEAQVLQLKNWPLVVFDKATSSAFTWDPDKKTVTFTIKEAGRSRGAAWWKDQVSVLNGWVQVLLGNEWMIYVKCGNKTYSGSRNTGGGEDGNRPIAG